jgi:hypothetical protein
VLQAGRWDSVGFERSRRGRSSLGLATATGESCFPSFAGELVAHGTSIGARRGASPDQRFVIVSDPTQGSMIASVHRLLVDAKRVVIRIAGPASVVQVLHEPASFTSQPWAPSISWPVSRHRQQPTYVVADGSVDVGEPVVTTMLPPMRAATAPLSA